MENQIVQGTVIAVSPKNAKYCQVKASVSENALDFSSPEIGWRMLGKECKVNDTVKFPANMFKSYLCKLYLQDNKPEMVGEQHKKCWMWLSASEYDAYLAKEVSRKVTA